MIPSRWWEGEALKLAEKGDLSWRAIAKKLGIPRSTVSDFLRDNQRKERVKRGKSGHFNQKESHLIIADCQVKPGADLSHLRALGRFIADKKPDVIINIGDFFDMESLSSYDRGKLSFEGRRVIEDLQAGYEGMEELVGQWRNVRGYHPKMVFTLGNHEFRIHRFAQDNPEFSGFLGMELLRLEEYGWEVYPFLEPFQRKNIYYVHYLSNPFSGKPYGGSALNQLKNVGNSFVVGHKQTLDIAVRPTLDGKMQLGIINGAYYPHWEDYKGAQGNHHFRGVTLLHEVDDGFGCPSFISLEYLVDKYA